MLFVRPHPALLNTFAVIAMFLVVGELVKHIARKVGAQTAMFQAFSFAAALYRTIAPRCCRYIKIVSSYV